jgi:uncharacterized protein (UPF0332 family)/predicted nucleotidyltransferase
MGRQYTREEFAAKLGVAERGDPKLNAAADFAARLLSSPVGDSIARIVLFGSVARGEARPDSDIDLLVFGSGPHERLSWAVAEAAAETIVEYGESVAPLAFGTGRLWWPLSYLVYDSLRRGKEIYRMDDAVVRLSEARKLARKAGKILDQAYDVCEQGGYETAIGAAYQAAELAVKALLVLKPSVQMPGSHGGVSQVFAREYVRTGEAPRDWSVRLSQELQLRHKAWYDVETDPLDSEARAAIDFAGEVLQFLRERLDRAQPLQAGD